ncbi:MAG: sulfate adenylyltransferase subunit CysN [Acidobacteria bacterium]|nr:sulfate adenylyltransferase subunit CysN [Acidobacteriota bacterium]
MLFAQDEALRIEEFLERETSKELLRFFTAGSVDDGKSTLIGRLLYDARGVYEDQLASIRNSRVNRSSGGIDFSLLTDGLRAEREQGITIDVAYRYFSTPRRKFIIADTPGHEQYTRNMATGASTAALAIILVDARLGVLPQTRRHAAIASLLGIPRVVLAVNKMDLVGYSWSTFENVRAAFLDFAESLGFDDILPIPVSALEGVNVARRGQAMRWYTGPTLLEHLESVPTDEQRSHGELRFPVQYVNRPGLHFRGYAGQIASGTMRKGDPVLVLPSAKTSRIASITTFDGDLDSASTPMSVTVTLDDERDISRGDILVHPHARPLAARAFDAHLVWMAEDALVPDRSLLIKLATQQVTARVSAIHGKLVLQDMDHAPSGSLALNDIGMVRIEASRILLFDPYRLNRSTGSFILIDAISNATVAAGMILSAVEGTVPEGPVTASDRRLRSGHSPALLALSNRALALRLERRLFDQGCWVFASGRPVPDVSVAWNAGLILIAPEIADHRARDLDALPLPNDEDAALDALVAHLEQEGVIGVTARL